MALPPIGNKDPVVERLKAEGQLNRNSGTNSIKSLKSITIEGFSELTDIMRQQLAFDKRLSREAEFRRIEDKREARSKAAAALGAAGAAATAGGTISSGGDAGGGSGMGAAGLAAGAGLFSGIKDAVTKALGVSKKPPTSPAPSKAPTSKSAAKGGMRGANLLRGGGALAAIGMAVQGASEANFADEEGQGKTSSFIGGALGGGEGGIANAALQAASGAAVGAAIGSVVPVIGTAIGGIVGGMAGGIAGAIGGENITDFLDDTGEQILGIFGETLEISSGRKTAIEKRLVGANEAKDALFNEIEELDQLIKESDGKDLESIEKRKELEKKLADTREEIARDKNTLVRSEMAVLEKEKEAIESKKELTAEDEKRVAELEAQRQKLKESSDYQKDIGDKVADIGSAISDSFSSAIDGLGDFFSSKRSTSGQMKTRNRGGGFARPEGTSSGGQMSRTAGRIEEITGFNQDSIDALNAVPMDGNRVTGFSIMQRNKLRQMRNRNRAISNEEITGFTSSALAKMNAVPMRGNEITGFSMMQRNRMRKFNQGTLGNGGELLQDFGDGTPVMLHGKEAVLTEEQLGQMFAMGGLGQLMGRVGDMGNIRESIASAVGRSDDAETAQIMEMLSDEKIMKAKEQSGIKQEHFAEILNQPVTGGDRRDNPRKQFLRINAKESLVHKIDDGTFHHRAGVLGRFVYNSHGELIEYHPPTMGGMRFKKNLVSGDISTTSRTTMDGVGVKMGSTINRQGELMGRSASFNVGGLTVSGDYTTEAGGGGLTSGSVSTDFKYKMGDLTVGGGRRQDISVDGVESGTELTNLSYAQSPTEMFRRENESPPVIIGGSTSNVNNVTKQYSSAKPHARNQDSSLRLARAAGA